MITVIRGREIKPAVFEYQGTVSGRDFKGISRQPLLDACRQVKSILGEADTPGIRVGVEREGRPGIYISCNLEWGAAHTIVESYSDGMRVLKYHKFSDIDKRAF